MGIPMMGIVDDCIGPQQMGFAQTRYLIDNVSAVMLAIEQARFAKEGLLMISLDQEKAYDRVSWPWLFAVMKDMNFPEEWIAAVELTHRNPTVQFFLNNNFTKDILYKYSILQGGSMSVILYIISIQPL